jgi:hypothetical protein
MAPTPCADAGRDAHVANNNHSMATDVRAKALVRIMATFLRTDIPMPHRHFLWSRMGTLIHPAGDIGDEFEHPSRVVRGGVRQITGARAGGGALYSAPHQESAP